MRLATALLEVEAPLPGEELRALDSDSVSYTHLRAHETVLDLVCRLLLENKNRQMYRDGALTATDEGHSYSV